jgi:hypothetical protein
MPKVEIEKWRKQTGQNDNEDETEEEDCTPVPHFTIQAKNLAFGGLITRVLQIECAEIDALYLKSLCGTCATQENFQHGTFLPQGIHLMSSPDTYKHLIADQNEYLNDIVNIPVIGLPNEIFSVDVKNEDGETLNDVIHESELFVSVEATPRTHDLGKFHFLTCKSNEEEAALWIDQNLAKWESKYLPEKYKLTGFEHPKRTSMNFASPGLMLYAATLKREVHERDRPVNKDFMKAPDTNKRRRTYLEVSFGKDEFPVIEGKKNKPAKPTQESSNTQTNKAPTEKENKIQVDTLTEMLKKSEEKLTRSLTATNESFDRKLTLVQNAIQENINKLQAVHEAAQEAHKLEIEILKTAFSELQAVQSHQNGQINMQLSQLLHKAGTLPSPLEMVQEQANEIETRAGKEKRAKTGDPMNTQEANTTRTDTTQPMSAPPLTGPGGTMAHGYQLPTMETARMNPAYGGPGGQYNMYPPPPQLTSLQMHQQQQYQLACGLYNQATPGTAAAYVQASPGGQVV